MPIQVDAFLRTKGFSANPFRYTNAEQERDHLTSYFVHVTWFNQLVGDPGQPESLILFAPQGHGKTIHRLEVARIASSHSIPALVVNFTDFGSLLAEQRDSLGADRYITLIRQYTLEALMSFLQRYPRRNQMLQERHTDAFSRLCALLHLYAPLQAVHANVPLNEDIQRWTSAFKQTELGLKAWLHELMRLVQAAGCASVYILIDGVDETHATRRAPEVAARLLSPLLDAPGLLQECGFAFKFFLPNDLEMPLYQQHIGRFDRLPVYHLHWNDAELLDMLAKRLNSYSLITKASHSGIVKRFSDLCHTGFDADTLLVQAAQTSPRKLIDLARHIIDEHCKQADTVDSFIHAETITTVLNKLDQLPYEIPAIEHSELAVQPKPIPPDQVAADAPTLLSNEHEPVADIPLLFFDEQGTIWVGNQPRKSLSKNLRKCMDYLWQHRHRTVRYNELSEALYGDEFDVKRGDPDSSRYKIVQRLRNAIEPDKHNSTTYIETQAGVGYVLRHFHEVRPQDEE